MKQAKRIKDLEEELAKVAPLRGENQAQGIELGKMRKVVMYMESDLNSCRAEAIKLRGDLLSAQTKLVRYEEREVGFKRNIGVLLETIAQERRARSREGHRIKILENLIQRYDVLSGVGDMVDGGGKESADVSNTLAIQEAGQRRGSC